MNGRGITFLLLIAAHIAPLDVRAQQPKVVPGTKVRVTVPSEGRYPLVGTIREIGDTTLTLDRRGSLMELPFSSVSKLEVSIRAADGTKWLKGAGIGFLAGAGAGVVIGLAAGDSEPGLVSFSAEDKAIALGVVLGTAGAVLGAVAGAADGRERWAEVTGPFTELGLDILPRPNGVFSLTLRRRF